MYRFLKYSLVLVAVMLLNSLVAFGVDKTYNVNQNGDYVFKIKDKAGWETTLTVPIKNIDTIKPIIEKIEVKPVTSIDETKKGILKEDLELHIETSDELSGVNVIEYQVVKKGIAEDPTQWKAYDINNKPQIAVEAEYTAYARCVDKASNKSDVKSIEFMLDKTPPEVSYTLSTEQWTQELSIKITAQDNLSGIESIELPDGQLVNKSETDFSVDENDTYKFVVTNGAKKSTLVDVEVTNIEKTITPPKQLPVDEPLPPPEELREPDNKEFDWSAEPINVDFKSIALSGVKMYQYKTVPTKFVSPVTLSRNTSITAPEKEWQDTEKPTVKVGDEGIHSIRVRSISNAGNVSKESNYKVKTDYTPPKITHTIDGNNVHIYATDDLSGIDHLMINGNRYSTGTVVLTAAKGTQNIRAYDGVGLFTDYTIKLPGGAGGGGGNNDTDETSKVPIKPSEPMVKPDLPIEPPATEAKPLPPAVAKPIAPVIEVSKEQDGVQEETTKQPIEDNDPKEEDELQGAIIEEEHDDETTGTETSMSISDICQTIIFVVLIVVFILLVCYFMCKQAENDITTLETVEL